jgi:hypothetical protein
VKLRLSDADRERLGCPEWLDFDLTNMSVDEGIALEVAGGDYTRFFGGGAETARTRVWVALHRAGITVTPYESLTFNLAALEMDGPVGKARSARAGRSTSSTSATSSRPSPRKRSAN